MRRLLSVALAAMLAVSCAKTHKDHPTASPRQALDLEADVYCNLEEPQADANGFVTPPGSACDLVLFNALRAAGCPAAKVDLTAAESAGRPGEWSRDDAQTCYPEGRTDSRFSRDMLEGLLVWIWQGQKDRAPVLDRLIAFGEANNWTICDAKDKATQLSKCVVGPGLEATIYEMRYRLGGADSSNRDLPQAWDPTATGTDAHVQVLHLYLRGLMFGAVSDAELAYLDLMASRNPDNHLFQAIAAKWRTSDETPATAAVLADLARFPAGTLPTSAGRCTDYVWQRPAGADWSPCPVRDAAGAPVAVATYTGIDLAFFRAVVSDGLPVSAPPPGAHLAQGGRRNVYHRTPK